MTEGIGVGEGDADGLAVGLATTFTPLSQISFVPDLMQVNLKPFTVEVVFNFVQGAPAFVTACAVFGTKINRALRIDNTYFWRFMA